MSSRAITFVAAAALAGACRSRAPAPVAPPQCMLDGAIGEPPAGARICDEVRGGVCGNECEFRIHACVLESMHAGTPFVAKWANNMIDGHGTVEAIVGRRDGDALAVRWLEWTVVSGYDRRSHDTGKAYFEVTERSCAQIVVGNDDRIRDDLDLRCTPDPPKRTVCSESI